MSATTEREQAFTAAHEAMAVVRLNNAIVRDTLLTPAESEARQAAFIECLDRAS